MLNGINRIAVLLQIVNLNVSLFVTINLLLENKLDLQRTKIEMFVVFVLFLAFNHFSSNKQKSLISSKIDIL